MSAPSVSERLVRVETILEHIAQQNDAAATARSKIYQAQEDARAEIAEVKSRLRTVESAIEKVQPTTVELERVRDRVQFAGKLGAALWTVGKALISAAAGAATVWYSMTGRPPP